jgi:hypothetical protein
MHSMHPHNARYLFLSVLVIALAAVLIISPHGAQAIFHEVASHIQDLGLFLF